MEKLIIEKEIEVTGLQVKEFPKGIQKAFDQLAEATKQSSEKDFYGISWFGDDDKRISYYAGVVTKSNLDGNYETLTIPKGEYRSQTISPWNGDPTPIRQAFQQLLPNQNPTASKPCIEWYKTHHDVVCMVHV